MSVHAKGVEETSADVKPKRRNRFSFAGEIPSTVAPGEQRREGLLLLADLLPQRLGENRAARIPPAHPPPAVLVDPDGRELVWLLYWKRAETERVDELENRRVGAGAERQGQNRHERECRVLSKGPHAVEEVVEHERDRVSGAGCQVPGVGCQVPGVGRRETGSGFPDTWPPAPDTCSSTTLPSNSATVRSAC